MADILITSPFQPFTLPTQFKAVFNGYIYCGTVDAVDPSVSQVQVYLVNESGDKVPVAQPLRTNAGGYLVYNGQPAKFVTNSNHSLLVKDALQVQVWYSPDISKTDPDAIAKIIGAQAREALRRSYAEAGFNLVDGSFESGGTVTTVTDILLFESEGSAYSWGGTLPKSVEDGSTPSGSGGIGPTAWIDQSNSLLRTEVIGRLDKDEEDISNIKIATSPNQRVKSIMLSAPRGGQRESELMTMYGYTALYPQGIAQDPQTGEWFVGYFPAGGAGDLNMNWFDVYDSNFVYTGKTFALRSRFAEGLLIGYVSGQRKIGHSGLTGDNFLRVTNVPATASIVDLQVIAPTLTSAVTCHTAMSSYGGVAAIMSPLGDNIGGTKYGMVRLFKLDEILSSAAPASGPIGTVNVSNGIIGSLDNAGQNETPPNPKTTKPQALALGPDGLAFYSGYQWYLSSVTFGNGHNPKISQFSLDGNLKSANVMRVSDVSAAFSAAGIPGTLIEPEGLMYDRNGDLISCTVVGTNNVLCAEGVSIPGKTQVNVPCTYVGGQGGSILDASYMTRGISTLDHRDLNTADRAADYCTLAGLSTLRFQLVSGFTFTVAGKSFTEGTVFVENLDGNFFFISIISNAGEYKFGASGASPRNWGMKTQVYGGAALTNPAPLNSLTQRGAGGFGQDKYLVAAANAHTAIVFANVTNGAIGSVAMSATATAFNTTSDEKLKNEHGPMPDALDVIQQMVEGGAVQLAAFKSTPDDIRPMALARRLHEIYPWAVTPGHGEPGDDDFIPWQVDYSQLVPLLILALSQK